MRKIYNLLSRIYLPLTVIFLLLSLSFDSFAQVLKVSGTVKDEKGVTMPGVSVTVKGTTQGVSTDPNGKFSLTVSGTATLIFRFVGYTTKEEAINGRSVVNVSLVSESSSLSEIIVTGVFDKRTAMNASIAISSISAIQIEKQAPLSSADLLKNIPGVYVNSSLGEIRNTVYSRGVSVGSNDGASGYYYVSMQEDGLPVTNATYGNYGPDYFSRPDATLGKLEALRGGTASILGNNAPGGIFNYISKQGGQAFEGEARIKYGLEGDGRNPYYRGDIDFGGALSKDGSLTYNLGGFYRNSVGAKDPGYPLNKGGQIKGNIVKKYRTGSIKIYGKYLNDHNGWFEFTPTTGFTYPKPATGFTPYSSVLIPNVTQSYPVNDNGTATYKSSSLIHSIDRSAGANWTQHLDSGLTFNNAIRYSNKQADWNTTAIVNPLALNDFVTASILGYLGRTGTTTLTNARTGAPLATISSFTGYDYNITNTGLPGGNVSPNSVFFEPLNVNNNKVKELLDQFSFSKKVKNMSFTLGGFYGYTLVNEITGIAGVAAGTIQDHPDLVNISFADPSGKVYQLTNPNGVSGVGGSGLTVNNATQNQVALFFGHNWQITNKLNVDYGFRFESMHQKGSVRPNVGNPKSSDPAYGGADGNPLTVYDNYGGTAGTPLPFNKTINTFSYSAGLNYTIDNHFSIYGRYSEGNKAPDLSTYFAANTVFANSSLNPQAQKVDQAEMGVKVRDGSFTAFVTPFYSVLSHVPNVQTFTLADGTTSYSPPVLYEKIKTYGLELEANINITKDFSIKGVGTFQTSKASTYKVWIANQPGPQDDAIMDYSGNKADNSPNLILNVTPSYNVGNFFSFVTWSYLGAREANVANAFKLPGFSQYNLGAGYNFTKKFQLSANINNILNKYGVMSWSRPGTFLTALDREGYTKTMYEADVKANTPYSTIAIPPRAYFLTLTYKF
ncbi:TonB-dependent receptor [Mucilaginibacter sp. cycad4]|uniref:TonB-dependent receptor n=1 Tax=Mucilaginibacter sp. cycad4 TaxID=3342096 RepID=UPI002AAA6977|nr:TonB-dependent receptor [Mucilaginibacter gossypii]WPV01966.1 TonB-dependent receptor [Mucilaginibacter gossypii]